MNLIRDIVAREILDSRGIPTVEVDLYVDSQIIARASVASGISSSLKSAYELRDKTNRYFGMGVTQAVNAINHMIKPYLLGKIVNQIDIDHLLINLDGTKNKSKIGANAIFPVSLAVLRAQALCEKKELYEYLTNGKVSMPVPMMNLISGQKQNNLNFKEFMIVPVMKNFKERLRAGTEVYQTLKKILEEQELNTMLSDDGSFAPNLSYNTLALDLMIKAIKESGYIPGKDIFFALDISASSIYNKANKYYMLDHKEMNVEQLLAYYEVLTDKYPIISLEDPFEENDLLSLSLLTKKIGNHVMIIGDNFFSTNKAYLEKGIKHKAGNAIVLKANEVGTITEFIECLVMAKLNKYQTVIAHRNGDTMDTFIADFAVGLNIPYIKTGAPARGECIEKYNQLLRIEEKLK